MLLQKKYELKALQELLKFLGCYQGAIDGIFGPLSKTAMVKATHGLESNPTVHAANLVYGSIELGGSYQQVWFMQTMLTLHQNHTPYIWGGQSLSAVDCSGAVMVCLKRLAPTGNTQDFNAQALFSHSVCLDLNNLHYNTLEESTRCIMGTGPLLAFYGEQRVTAPKVTHVMGIIDKPGATFAIGSSGGGRQTTSEEVARICDARVKLLPLRYRGDLLTVGRLQLDTLWE